MLKKWRIFPFFQHLAMMERIEVSFPRLSITEVFVSRKGVKVMKNGFRPLIVMTFRLILLGAAALGLSGKPAMVFGNDVIVRDECKRKYDPEKGHHRLVPGNYKRIYDPEKQLEVLMPDYYACRHDPERGIYRLVPDSYVRKYDPEKDQDRLVPDYYERRYDPERGHDRLVPRDYKKVYDPEKGRYILTSGGYTTVRDEIGNEIGRIRTSDIRKLIRR